MTAPDRLVFIDVLRGFALVGILFVNAIDITGVGAGWVRAHATALPHDLVRDLLYATMQTRFVRMSRTATAVPHAQFAT